MSEAEDIRQQIIDAKQEDDDLFDAPAKKTKKNTKSGSYPNVDDMSETEIASLSEGDIVLLEVPEVGETYKLKIPSGAYCMRFAPQINNVRINQQTGDIQVDVSAVKPLAEKLLSPKPDFETMTNRQSRAVLLKMFPLVV